MIMKNIFKIKIHPLLYLLMFICIITGLFRELILFMLIIIIHELGHITMGLLLKQKIEKVILLPFGGITIFRMKLNISIYKEFLIAITGPIFQIIGFIILSKYINNSLFNYYNLVILLFNLIPIYPLDGSKILNCFFNILFNFKVSFYMTIILSFLLIIFLCIFILFNYLNFFLFIIIFFLGYKVLNEYLNYPNIYNKFLFERYIYDFNFERVKYINNINKMYKGKRHLVKEKGIWKTEKEILRKRFDFQRNIC